MKFDCNNKHYLIILSIFQIAFLDERGLRNPNCTVRSRCCYLFSRFIKSHRYVCGHYVLQFWYVCSHDFCSSLLVCLWSLLMFFSVGMPVVITGTYFLQCWYVCGHYLFSSVLVCLWSLLRERVQISASGHTDANQLGTDFFPIPLKVGPDFIGTE